LFHTGVRWFQKSVVGVSVPLPVTTFTAAPGFSVKPVGNTNNIRPAPPSSRRMHLLRSNVRPLTFVMVTLSLPTSPPTGSASIAVIVLILNSPGCTVSATQQMNGTVCPPAVTLTTCGVMGAAAFVENANVKVATPPARNVPVGVRLSENGDPGGSALV